MSDINEIRLIRSYRNDFPHSDVNDNEVESPPTLRGVMASAIHRPTGDPAAFEQGINQSTALD
jgi:hypothetical protein